MKDLAPHHACNKLAERALIRVGRAAPFSAISHANQKFVPFTLNGLRLSYGNNLATRHYSSVIR